MPKIESFLQAKGASFADAFQYMKSFSVQVNNDITGKNTGDKNSWATITSESSSTKVFCSNPRCNGGYFDLGAYLMHFDYPSDSDVDIDNTVSCNGYEERPTRTMPGMQCSNNYKLRGKLVFQAS